MYPFIIVVIIYFLNLIDNEVFVSFSLIYIMVLYEYLACAKCVASKLFTILYMIYFARVAFIHILYKKNTLLLILNVEHTILVNNVDKADYAE